LCDPGSVTTTAAVDGAVCVRFSGVKHARHLARCQVQVTTDHGHAVAGGLSCHDLFGDLWGDHEQ
jgi:hypothetical protein